MRWELSGIVTELRDARERWRNAHHRLRGSGIREFPSGRTLREIIAKLCEVLFPLRLGPVDVKQESEDYFVGYTLDRALSALLWQVEMELAIGPRQQGQSEECLSNQVQAIVREFARRLPSIRVLLDFDIEAAFVGDPAARSVDEVLLCYPGVRAIIHHRLAHCLYELGLPLLARIVAEIAHSETGIDIHPGAKIGNSFFIDHGTGVVIGETAVVGNRVRLYQAVTLGAKRFQVDDSGVVKKGEPRHPVVEDDVVIYAGATILGRITIGRGSIIGGNVWLTHSVPPGSQITQGTSRQEGLEQNKKVNNDSLDCTRSVSAQLAGEHSHESASFLTT